MPQFVLEIGAEEIPARFLSKLEQDLTSSLSAALTEAHVDFKNLSSFATPRRFGVMAEHMAEAQLESEETVTGPPKKVAYDADGNPTKAGLGFAKTQGVDLADAFILETDKGEYLAVRKKTGGAKVADLLPELLVKVISSLPFPKRMRWGDMDVMFARPLRWFLCLLGQTVVKFELAGIASGNQTWGHRVHGFGPHDVAAAEDFASVLAGKAKVTAKSDDRKKVILAQGDELAAKAKGRVVWKDSLLDEVAGLVEHPQVILGDFDPSILEIPREALLCCMESHQKSFGVEGADGKLLPHFISTLNMEPKDPANVKKGWERVLKARLEDARFFWNTDLKSTMDEWAGLLDNVIYLGPLGSMGDKSRRIEALCRYLAEQLEPSLADDAARAGRIAKADLVSEMVGEFADLQGIMGGIYAAKQGESEAVSRAIYEHYLPAGPDTEVPSTLAGALVSLADRVDTLTGCFGLKMIPTGAADPYALRRAALAVCRIILEKDLRLDLAPLFTKSLELYGDVQWKLKPEETLAQLKDFMAQRLKGYFQGKGAETLVAEAAIGAGTDDVRGLAARVKALGQFSQAPDFEQAVLTFKRAGNIIRKQGTEAGQPLTGEYKADQLEEDAEKALAKALEEMAPRFDALWDEDRYDDLMGLLRELRPAVDAFFDNVMVMCEDPNLRLNRLNLLQALVSRLGRLADFNALQV